MLALAAIKTPLITVRVPSHKIIHMSGTRTWSMLLLKKFNVLGCALPVRGVYIHCAYALFFFQKLSMGNLLLC